jgi:hypothetical protein
MASLSMIGEILEFLRRMAIPGDPIKRDLGMLRTEIQPLVSELIPFTHQELEILSLSFIDKTSGRGFNKIRKGIFNTIFYEHLMAYSVKQYAPGSHLIIIAVSDREIAYYVKDKVVKVFFGGRELGVMDRQGRLYNTKRQVIAEIDGNDNLPSHATRIMNEDMGFITNPKFVDKKESTRAYQMIKDMTEDQRSIFMSLTLLNLVEESLGI